MTEEEDRRRLTRRRFVTGTLGSAAAAGLAGSAAPAVLAKGGAHEVDVVVVGAGMAGLSAARRLHRARRSVLVLEARDRVGGRCYSRPIGGGQVANMGATFVGPGQKRIQALMREVGIHKVPVYSAGKLLWYENGRRTPYTGEIPPVSDPKGLAEIAAAQNTIDQLAATVPLHAPWTAPNAAALDSLTVQTWADQHFTSRDAFGLLQLIVEAVLSVQPRDVSFLYFLAYVHAAGGLNPLVANVGSGGAQDFHVAGGTQGIAVAVARRLGHRVMLGQPVRRIAQSSGGVTVYADGVTVRARRVIVAIPPHLAGRIIYEPELNARRVQFTQRVPIGSLVKTYAIYDRPFWRAEGLNGQANSDTGPVSVTFDLGALKGGRGVLMGFVNGDDARRLSDLPPAERRRRAIASYVRLFGEQAAHPRRYLDQVWDRETYTGGCPVGIMPPGVMTEYGRALRAPCGRIHWAGTETATVWTGYMDGAVQSGERAAAEVLRVR